MRHDSLNQALIIGLSTTNSGGLHDSDIHTLKNKGATEADILDLNILLASEQVPFMPGIKIGHINIVDIAEPDEPTAEDLLAQYIMKVCEDEGVTNFNEVTFTDIFSIAVKNGIKPDVLRTKNVMLAIGKAIIAKNKTVH